MCFRSLEYTELGLNYSLLANSVEERGYSSGRYYLGIGHGFIKFPATVQTIQFANEADSVGPMLRSRTSDGLEVQLEVSFQYQLNASDIHGLYMAFGLDYEKVFITLAMDMVTALATNYNATAFFNDRITIGMDMEDQLKQTFGQVAHAQVPFFQLRSVDLPADFEHAIQDTEVKKQDIQTAMAERENQEVVMETKVLQAQQKAQEIAFQANASAQDVILQANAYVAQFSLSQQLQAQSLQPIYDDFFKGSEDQFMEYLQVRTLRNHPDTNSIVNMGAPAPK